MGIPRSRSSPERGKPVAPSPHSGEMRLQMGTPRSRSSPERGKAVAPSPHSGEMRLQRPLAFRFPFEESRVYSYIDPHRRAGTNFNNGTLFLDAIWVESPCW
jgi:hypothetical protein